MKLMKHYWELNDQCIQLNAFELLSSMHNENKLEKLVTRFIYVVYDGAQNVEKRSNTCEIENFLKHYKTVEVDDGDGTSEIYDIILSKEQNEVLEICKNQLNASQIPLTKMKYHS